MTREQFSGIWQLVSFEFRLADCIVIHPMDEGVTGILIYDFSHRITQKPTER